jgi:hypothetical protein
VKRVSIFLKIGKSNFNFINLKKNDCISPRQEKLDTSTLNPNQHMPRQKYCDMSSENPAQGLFLKC